MSDTASLHGVVFAGTASEIVDKLRGRELAVAARLAESCGTVLDHSDWKVARKTKDLEEFSRAIVFFSAPPASYHPSPERTNLERTLHSWTAAVFLAQQQRCFSKQARVLIKQNRELSRVIVLNMALQIADEEEHALTSETSWVEDFHLQGAQNGLATASVVLDGVHGQNPWKRTLVDISKMIIRDNLTRQKKLTR